MRVMARQRLLLGGCVILVMILSTIPVLAAEDAHMDVVDFKNIDIVDALKILSQKSGMNMAVAPNVNGRVTLHLKDVGVMEALDLMADMYGLAYHQEMDVVRIFTAVDYEKRFGHPFNTMHLTRIFSSQFVPIERLSGFAKSIKSNSGSIYIDPTANHMIMTDDETVLNRVQQFLALIDVPMATRRYQLKYAQVADLKSDLTAMTSATSGYIHFDQPSNQLIVADSATRLERIQRLVETFDQRPQEVLIEAKILQVVLNDEFKMGINWEALADPDHHLNFAANLDVLNSAQKFGRASIGQLEQDRYQVLLEALETAGETRILSNPRITAINRQEAKILVGSTEPYVTSTTTTPSSGPTTTAESVNFIEVGVKLFTTPTIHPDGFITLKIKPEVSSVTRTVVTANNNTIPVVETSEAETTVLVEDGATIVIGGLIKRERIQSVRKIPLMGEAPLVGTLFRSREELDRTTEIVILLTPRIVSGQRASELSAMTAIE